jgi:hypothetical protein
MPTYKASPIISHAQTLFDHDKEKTGEKEVAFQPMLKMVAEKKKKIISEEMSTSKESSSKEIDSKEASTSKEVSGKEVGGKEDSDKEGDGEENPT